MVPLILGKPNPYNPLHNPSLSEAWCPSSSRRFVDLEFTRQPDRSGFRFSSFGFGVLDLGFRHEGLGFRI